MRRITVRLVVALLAVIIVVVGAISYGVIPSHDVSLLHAREAELQADLLKMRKLIDQYAADNGSLPKSLDQLVSAGYLREIPEDPITGKRDWVVVVGHDPNSAEGGGLSRVGRRDEGAAVVH